MSTDIYQLVTDRIIELLDKGTVPWRSPIRSSGSSALPTNLISGNEYRGINVFLLAMTAWIEGYSSPYWLTFRQARQLKGHVRKKEKGSLVIFWKQYATTDQKTGEPISIPVLRRFTAFNAEQCEGIETPKDLKIPSEDSLQEFKPIETATQIAAGYKDGPTIEHRGPIACYSAAMDKVRLPDPGQFETAESYHSTLFHELVHSTGHSRRLDRGLDTSPNRFGSAEYSREELVAEMGAAFLSAAAGIETKTIDQSAAYINGWRKKLSQDPKLVIRAASAGQRAADWIRGIHHTQLNETQPSPTESG